MPFGASRLNGLGKYIVVTPSGKTVNIVGSGNIASYGKIGNSYYNQDGSAWLEIAQDSAFAFGTSTDFTMEGWFWTGGTINDRYFWDGRGDANSVAVLFDGTFLKAYIAGAYRIGGAANALEPNTWNHIAYTRSGTTGTLWANGVSVGTWTDTTNYTHSNSIKILSRYVFGQGSPNCYCDEFRISDTARYTTTFTPTTTGFSSDANTLLLLHLDSGTTNRTPKTITANGDARIIATQSKFGGQSCYFDGTGDYLSTATNANFGFGTGDFTIEGWFYKTAVSTQYLFDTRTTLNENSVAVQSNGSGSLRLFVNGSFVLTSSSAHTNNAWNHLAISRASGVTRFFINGVVDTNTYTDATDYGATKPLVVGSQYNGTTAFNGYVDEFRVSNTARYTATFTPSTTAFTNDSDTQLLLHMGGLGNIIYDDPGYNAMTDSTGSAYTSPRTAKTLTLSGNTQISATQSKFGPTSAFFDGTTDYLSVTPTTDFATGTAAFTTEFYVRFGNTTTAILFDTRPASTQGNYQTIYWTGSTIRFYASGADRITSSSLSTATWYHVALVRSGDDFKLYINGTQSGSTFTSSASFGAGQVIIGADSYTLGTSSLNGQIDEVRFSDTARYTATFTPSTTQFTNDANTKLLLHMDGLFEDDNGSATPPYPTIVNLGGSATSLTTTITVPSTVKQGDLLVLADFSTTVTDTTPSGWTQASGVTTTGIRTNISYKIATAADVGATVTGMAGTTRKVLTTYQGNYPFTSVRLSPTITSQATVATPTNQTITMSGIRAPIIAFAVYAATGAIGTRGWSGGTPSENSSVSTSGIYVKTLMYNVGSTPANATISMTDSGTNTLQSLYFRPF